MTAVENAAVSQEELDAKAWAGFTEGNWQKDIDVRDFIQKNYTPYEGDETFLAPATEKTKHLWKYLDDNYLAVERKQRVYDVDTHTPADVDAFPAGYIDSPEVDNVVVGLQTDVPCKRAMMPNGGWRMVEQAIKEAGKEPDPEIKKIFTKYRKTHNDGVFGVYTKQIKVARHNKILTGLPDAYGRGRIIGDYRRVALYGVNKLIAFKKRDKDSVPYRNDFTEPEIEHWIRFREEHDEQIKALKKLINLGNEYGLDLSRPAQTAQEAVQPLQRLVDSVICQADAAVLVERLAVAGHPAAQILGDLHGVPGSSVIVELLVDSDGGQDAQQVMAALGVVMQVGAGFGKLPVFQVERLDQFGGHSCDGQLLDPANEAFLLLAKAEGVDDELTATCWPHVDHVIAELGFGRGHRLEDRGRVPYQLVNVLWLHGV